ncbi:MAG: hypothetical protein JW895_07905 [Thermoleophilaceae bacterium]|nr:hypothetical protein [Thermoleophilaceae bacterium]
MYQLVLIAVAYDRLRPAFLRPSPAGRAHRAVGDTIAGLLVITAVMCVSYFGFEDDAALHAVAAVGLLIVLALKICVVRWWHRLGPMLPVLGISVWVLLALTWITSAGAFLADS